MKTSSCCIGMEYITCPPCASLLCNKHQISDVQSTDIHGSCLQVNNRIVKLSFYHSKVISQLAYNLGGFTFAWFRLVIYLLFIEFNILFDNPKSRCDKLIFTWSNLRFLLGAHVLGIKSMLAFLDFCFSDQGASSSSLRQLLI